MFPKALAGALSDFEHPYLPERDPRLLAHLGDDGESIGSGTAWADARVVP